MIREASLILLTSALIACGGSSSNSDPEKAVTAPVETPPPVSTAKVLGDIEFEDGFIKNCVLKSRQVYDSVTGQYKLEHGLVDVGNLVRDDYREISVDAVTSLSGCNSYNSFEIVETSDQATTLADLKHFPKLTKVYLDFESVDWQYLSQLHQIESVFLHKTNLADLSLVTKLPSLVKLTVYESLADWSFLQYAENLEGFTTPFTEDEAFTGFPYLTDKLEGLSFQGAKLSQQQLNELDRFRQLEGLSIFFYEYDNNIDLTVVSELKKLLRFYLYHQRVDDLSFLNKSLERLLVTINEDFNFAQLEQFTQLKSLDLELERATNTKRLSPFSLQYINSEVSGFHVAKPNDTTFAEVVLNGIEPSYFDGKMKVAKYDSSDTYLLSDIPRSEFITLIKLWLEQKIEFV